MPKILVCSNDGVSDGFGRISMSINTALFRRNYDVMAASYTYDGKLPALYDGQRLPYFVSTMRNPTNYFVEDIAQIIAAIQPDIVMVCQDFPYACALRYAPIDWSRMGFIIITPVDGKPIYPMWIDCMKKADAGLTISEFGVEAFAEAGVEVGLCRPGVNLDKFYRLTDDDRAALREKAGIEKDAFVLGTAAQNQGRKAIEQSLRAFFDFAKDKPNAKYVMDMDAQSPAGWDLESACKQFGFDRSKILFRADLFQRGILELRERYALMDVHTVLSHREGYGLPLAESMACGVCTAALDWCSGTEIVGDGKGLLIKPLMDGKKPFSTMSTWGGALDYYVSESDFVKQLQHVYSNPHERLALADKGMAWSRQHTWDAATDAVQAAVDKVYAKVKARTPQAQPVMMQVPVVPQTSPDGIMKTDELEKVMA